MDTISSVTQSAAHKAMTATDEMMQFSRGNLEALTKANQILATGIQDFMKSQTELAKLAMTETMAAVTSFGSAKSLKDIMDIQSGLMRSAMQRMMENHRQATSTALSLTEQSFAPIKAQISLAAAKFSPAA